MTESTTEVKTIRPVGHIRSVVLLLFLFSGVSGLIYEVVWSRMFALVLGTTVYAVATVLGVFMGGLALGSWAFGRYVDRAGTNGLRMYALLELVIGVFAVVLPSLISLSNVIYRAAWPAVSDSFAGQMVLRVGLATAILIIPATMMGGTLPVLSRFLVRSRQRTGGEIGTLYGVNTLGAVVGCFMAGYFLLEYLGMRNTLLLAAALNVVVAGLAFLWSGQTSGQPALETLEEEPPESVRRYGAGQVRLALVLYAFSGFAALALEVLWTRSLMYFTSVDTYAFTAMLSAFLCGLGLGSLVVSPVVGRIRHPMFVLGVVEVLIGVTAAISIPLFKYLHGAFESVAGTWATEPTLWSKIVTKLFCSFFIMFIPTLLMGAAFPLASMIYVGARRRVGQGIGTLYALNTVGAIAGAMAGGFLIIPAVGIQRGILLCASLYVTLGLVLCAAAPRRLAARGPLALAAALGIYGLGVFNQRFSGEPAILQSRFFKIPGAEHRILFFHEGPGASLAVLENPVGTKLLNINGITTAINNHMDMQVHRMLSHLPILLHPDPRNVLVVGFGMGSTPWGCCQHTGVERVDVVELLRSEKRTAPIFEDVNHGVLSHPKLRFIEGDGRNFLLATRRTYDVVSFNAIHPRYSAYLYTEDFYRLCRERLSSDGVICAWLTQNSMKDSEFRMLCRSFVEVFPHASLWYCNPEHFCLIGTMQPTQIDLNDWGTRMSAEPVRRDLADSNLADPRVLVSRLLLGEESLADYVGGAPLNTDDRPRIEFTRSSKADERPIIERLITLRHDLASILEGGSGTEVKGLADYEEGARWLMIGQTELWYPRPDGALRSEMAFRRALLLCPDNQDVRHNLTFSEVIKQQVGQDLEARPDDPGVVTRVGTILMEEGHLDQAQMYLLRALSLHNTFVPAAERLGFVQLFRGDLQDSVAWLSGILMKAKPDDPQLQYALSVAYERLGDTQQAESYRRKALATEPDVAEWFTLLEGTVRMMTGRPWDAE